MKRKSMLILILVLTISIFGISESKTVVYASEQESKENYEYLDNYDYQKNILSTSVIFLQSDELVTEAEIDELLYDLIYLVGDYSSYDEFEYIGNEYDDNSGYGYSDEYESNENAADYDFTENNDNSESNKEKISAVKELLTKLLPKEKMNRITEITSFTDGKENVLAFVEPIDSTSKKWHLAFDSEDVNLKNASLSEQREVLRTFIHEYAHIESLNETQMKQGDFNRDKGEIKIQEGILKKNSYLAQFASKFWTKDMIAIVEKQNPEDMLNLYYDNETSFVTEYASSNFVEDFAESFAEFVLSDKKTNNSIASQKVNFFYDIPEFVKLREHMRKHMTSKLK